MSKIRLDAEKTPISHVIIVALFAIGLVALPFDLIIKLFVNEERMVYYISQALPRIIFTVVAAIFVAKYKFNKIFSCFSFFGVLLMLPALLVSINNAPIVGLISGSVTPNCDIGLVLAYLLYCISVGFFEEIVFRGIIFPLCLIMLKRVKNSVFWSVALSSAVFSISHIVNLFAGMSFPAVLLQLGYTFLIGSMCAISLVKSKNIFVPIFLHAVYDIGGLALVNIGKAGGLFNGYQWDTLTIIITLVLGVIVFVYMLIILLKNNEKQTKEMFNIEERDITN